MESFETVAVGINLRLTTTAEGGRQTPLLGGSGGDPQFKYRPNWGLPGWQSGVQTAGPVLGFSREDIHPGESARAVVVALFPKESPEWLSLQVGDVLRMYEGSRVCGFGTVEWTEAVDWRVQPTTIDRLLLRMRDADLGAALRAWGTGKTNAGQVTVVGPLDAPGMDPTWIVRIRTEHLDADACLFMGPYLDVSAYRPRDPDLGAFVGGRDGDSPETLTGALDSLWSAALGGSLPEWLRSV